MFHLNWDIPFYIWNKSFLATKILLQSHCIVLCVLINANIEYSYLVSSMLFFYNLDLRISFHRFEISRINLSPSLAIVKSYSEYSFHYILQYTLWDLLPPSPSSCSWFLVTCRSCQSYDEWCCCQDILILILELWLLEN